MLKHLPESVWRLLSPYPPLYEACTTLANEVDGESVVTLGGYTTPAAKGIVDFVLDRKSVV